MVDLIQKLGGASFLEQFADSPANLAFVEAHFRDAEQAVCDALLECVDESPYSLRDWIEALRKVGHWLDARSLAMELGDQIGYVSCATDSAGAGANLTHLPSLVEEMLEAYGCERAVKK
ncbi:MAG: hypothetical protein ACSHX8_03440 [Opitutaceae bacterium]